MSFAKWLGFETKEEQERKRRLYLKRMYRFGQAEMDWEERILKDLFPRARDITTHKFAAIALRDRLLAARERNAEIASEGLESARPVSEEREISLWGKAQAFRVLKEDEKALILRMVSMELQSRSAEELPDAEAVRGTAPHA